MQKTEIYYKNFQISMSAEMFLLFHRYKSMVTAVYICWEMEEKGFVLLGWKDWE